MVSDYFQLRIPRDLKKFFDEYVKNEKPLGIVSGNDLARYILISKAEELKKELEIKNKEKEEHQN